MTTYSSHPTSATASSAAGWFVHTEHGVTLTERFDTREQAQTAYWGVVAELRREMVRNHRTRASIEERVSAVRVGYGVTVGEWAGFVPRAQP